MKVKGSQQIFVKARDKKYPGQSSEQLQAEG